MVMADANQMPPSEAMNGRPLQTVLAILLAATGGAIVLISLVQVALGIAAIPGAGPGNATLDSEHRFYAVFFLAFGLALLWCLQDLSGRARLIQGLMALFFLGGLTRVLSALTTGLPHPLFVGLGVIELLLPPLLAGLAELNRNT
jgi:hypothetical protein